MASSSCVVTPGFTRSLRSRSTSATIRQLSRMRSFSSADFIVAFAIAACRPREPDRAGSPAALELPALLEAVVMAHEEMRLDLLKRIEADAHDDEKARAAEEAGEIRRHAHADHERRENRHDRQEDRSGERDLRKNVVDEIGRVLPGPDAGDESALL